MISFVELHLNTLSFTYVANYGQHCATFMMGEGHCRYFTVDQTPVKPAGLNLCRQRRFALVNLRYALANGPMIFGRNHLVD